MRNIESLSENIIRDIGHAFGYYDYGTEHGLIDAFPNRDAVAAFICGYVRMALQSGMLYATSENGEAVYLCGHGLRQGTVSGSGVYAEGHGDGIL